MTRNAADKHKPRMELRIVLDAEDYADICALAKISGLAGSQYARRVLKVHLSRIYATAENKDPNP